MDAPDTVTEASQLLEAEGYDHSVFIRDGVLHFSGHDEPCPIERAVIERTFRFEGDSDPGDEMVVFGVVDSGTGMRGVLASAFGSSADPDVLEQLTAMASGSGAARPDA